MGGLRILGTGSALPQKCVTNDQLATFVDTSDAWIRSRTGIAQRYFCAEGESHTSLCVRAAQNALDMAGISPNQIGACIVATLSADNATPAAACLLQRELGLSENIPCFDLNAACSGFLYGMRVAQGFFNNPDRPYVLLIGAEKLSRLLDWNDRGTCVLFGDGAGAAVLGNRDSPVYFNLGCRGDDAVLHCSHDENFIRMEGQAVFRFATETLPKVVQNLLDQSGNTQDDIDAFLCHQANKRILDFAIKRLHADATKFYVNLDRFGNTSAASIPIALDEMVRSGTLQRGQRLLCVGFGAGLTWGGVMLTF